MISAIEDKDPFTLLNLIFSAINIHKKVEEIANFIGKLAVETQGDNLGYDFEFLNL